MLGLWLELLDEEVPRLSIPGTQVRLGAFGFGVWVREEKEVFLSKLFCMVLSSASLPNSPQHPYVCLCLFLCLCLQYCFAGLFCASNLSSQRFRASAVNSPTTLHTPGQPAI